MPILAMNQKLNTLQLFNIVMISFPKNKNLWGSDFSKVLERVHEQK